MDKVLFVIGVICLLGVPCLLSAGILKKLRHQPSAIWFQGMGMMAVFAIFAFVLSYMLGGFGGSSGGFSGGERPSGTSSERSSYQRPSESTGQRTMPSSSDFSSFSMPQGFRSSSSNKSAWIQVGIYALVLIAALGVVLLVRKRNE